MSKANGFNRKITFAATCLSLVFIFVGLAFYNMSEWLPKREAEKELQQAQAEQLKQQEQAVLEKAKLEEKQQVKETTGVSQQQVVTQPQQVVTQPQQVVTQPQQVVTAPAQVTEPPKQVETATQQSEVDDQIRMSPVVVSELGKLIGIKDVDGTLIHKESYLTSSSHNGVQLYSVNNMITVQSQAGKVFQLYITSETFEKLQQNSSLSVQYKEYNYNGTTIYEVLNVRTK